MLPSQIPLHEMFDLDSALTMPDYPIDPEKQQEDGHDDESTAAHRQLDEMPTVVTAEGGCRCTVCTEGLRLGAVAKRIPCGHVFHQSCISRWFSVNYSCPLCRQKLPPPPGKLSSD